MYKLSGATIEVIKRMIEAVHEEMVRVVKYAERMVASAVQEVMERARKIMTPSLMSFHPLRM